MKKLCKSISIFSFIAGLFCIYCGMSMQMSLKKIDTSVVKIEVMQNRVKKYQNNEIKLKDVKTFLGESISSNPIDYLKNPNSISSDIIKLLKLDISKVNINNIGEYTYTITFNKKIYNGNITVVKKPLPNIDITLNSLSYEVGTTLSTDLSIYIKETLAPEVISSINLDLSEVDVTKPGIYLYSVRYSNRIYTSTITIYEANKQIESDNKKESTE